MKNFVLIIALSFSSFVNAQIGNKKDWAIIGSIICTRLELTIMNDKSFLSFGPKIPLNENNYVSLRGHFNWWDTPERKFIVIPELDYFYKVADFKEKSMITNLYTGAGITPYAVSPKFGIVFYHFISAEAGYNIEYEPYKYFSTSGFRFSLGFNLVF